MAAKPELGPHVKCHSSTLPCSHRITIGRIIIPIVVLIMCQTLSSQVLDYSLGCGPQEPFPLSASVPGQITTILPVSGQLTWASVSSPAQGGSEGETAGSCRENTQLPVGRSWFRELRAQEAWG